jgi:Protein of unknwon function (DUF3310)
MKHKGKLQQVIDMMTEDPDVKASYIAKKLGTTIGYTYTLMSNARKKKPNKVPLKRGTLNEVPLIQFRDDGKIHLHEIFTNDNINHPPHYTTGGIETIDFIEAKQLDYHLGNVIKYITRADHKGEKLEDLRKAQWYLNRAIDNLSK